MMRGRDNAGVLASWDTATHRPVLPPSQQHRNDRGKPDISRNGEGKPDISSFSHHSPLHHRLFRVNAVTERQDEGHEKRGRPGGLYTFVLLHPSTSAAGCGKTGLSEQHCEVHIISVVLELLPTLMEQDNSLPPAAHAHPWPQCHNSIMALQEVTREGECSSFKTFIKADSR